ncbi:hypothetical protein L1987_09561 [Smallanthus sonchifolius]|uniref:Uncharacterized protein n=1 Tax=Smallanthus sonchifolius TaxID=185202 RepID=A0ACB9JPN5_9ASTR|nr:hypothetical protein L1987_09561 [Smallanthus sonchifolius]
MPSSCSIRAVWILNNQETVVFSREGSALGYGIRVKQSIEGSDSWVDDPIMRHIVSLHVKKEENGEDHTFWPLILHAKGQHYILVLPLVEPDHFKAYNTLCRRSDCGNGVGVDGNLSSLLLQLPCITGYDILLYNLFHDTISLQRIILEISYKNIQKRAASQCLLKLQAISRAFMVAHVLRDIITSDPQEPEVVISAGPSVGGLLDSLTGSIGGGSVTSDAPKIGPRNLDKDALRSFISTAMPFGTPLDLSYSNITAIRTNGFSTADVPPVDSKQPAWKPYLYKGKQRLLFTIHEIVNAAMYDRDEIPDSLSILGQVNCRAELEGLPDVLFPLTGLDSKRIEILSFHPCAQVPEQGGGDKQPVMFSPPLGNFVLLRYQAPCSIGVPVKGFYQLSMVSENEGAFFI